MGDEVVDSTLKLERRLSCRRIVVGREERERERECVCKSVCVCVCVRV
jgi:hypothetical protein